MRVDHDPVAQERPQPDAVSEHGGVRTVVDAIEEHPRNVVQHGLARGQRCRDATRVRVDHDPVAQERPQPERRVGARRLADGGRRHRGAPAQRGSAVRRLRRAVEPNKLKRT